MIIRGCIGGKNPSRTEETLRVSSITSSSNDCELFKGTMIELWRVFNRFGIQYTNTCIHEHIIYWIQTAKIRPYTMRTWTTPSTCYTKKRLPVILPMKNPYVMEKPISVPKVVHRKNRKQATALRTNPKLQMARWVRHLVLAINPAKNRPIVFATPVKKAYNQYIYHINLLRLLYEIKKK